MRLKLRDVSLLNRYMADRDVTNAWLGRKAGCTRECVRQLRSGRLAGCQASLATRIEEALSLLPGTLFAPSESHSMSSKMTADGILV